MPPPVRPDATTKATTTKAATTKAATTKAATTKAATAKAATTKAATSKRKQVDDSDEESDDDLFGSDEESESDDVYEVESILSHRYVRKQLHYHIAWKPTEQETFEPTWEPADSVSEDLKRDYHVVHPLDAKVRPCPPCARLHPLSSIAHSACSLLAETNPEESAHGERRSGRRGSRFGQRRPRCRQRTIIGARANLPSQDSGGRGAASTQSQYQ